MHQSRFQLKQSNNRRSQAVGCCLWAGFSLVELVVVMMLIAVAAAIAMPRYARSIQHYRVDAAARQVAHQLDFAQRQARATGKSVTVTFDTTGHSVQLLDSDSLLTNDTQLDEPPFQAALTAVVVANGGTLSFDGYGQANTTVTLTLAVGDLIRTVTLDTTTNKARVQ